MNNKAKLIAAGSVILILLVVVVYMNFFSTPAAPVVSPEADRVINEQMQHNQDNPAPEPDLTKVPEGARKPGGKSTGN